MLGECYVCMRSDAPPAPCACKTFVHVECLRTVMRIVPSHRTHCAVCRVPYGNVVVVHDCHVPSPYVGLILVYLALALVLTVYSFLSAAERKPWVTAFVITMETGCVVVTAAAHVVVRRRHGRWCCCHARSRLVLARTL